MSKEVFFDLDTNKELEGNYFYCNTKLIDIVFALIENGYEVIAIDMPLYGVTQVNKKMLISYNLNYTK